MTYDYKKGYKRLKEILDSDLIITEKPALPSYDAWTYENGYKSWVTAVFVDIRDSTTLFTQEDKVAVAKVIKAFTSEIIEILREDDNLRQIGIRGDCVYAIYTSPKKQDIYNIADKTFFVETYLKMLNKMLQKKNLPTIEAGIGMSTAKELVVMAGRKDTGIKDLVWIGEAVTMASNLSSLGNRDDNYTLVFSEDSYDNFIDLLVKDSPKAKTWFDKKEHKEYGTYYTANIIKNGFNDFVENL